MTEQTAVRTDEQRIRQLLERWADATRTGSHDEVLANHAPEVVIYDVLPPMKYKGADAYRESWDEWQPETAEPGLFEFEELEITAGPAVAFAYGIIHCGGTLPDGATFEDRVRATFCLRKLEDGWRVTHQHISMPRG